MYMYVLYNSVRIYIYVAIIIHTIAFDDVMIALWRVGILGSFGSVSHNMLSPGVCSCPTEIVDGRDAPR